MVRITEISPWMLDLRGVKMGMLTIVEPHAKLVYPSGSMSTYWKGICECGNEHIVHSAKFTRGEIQSCGCMTTVDMMDAKKLHKGKVLNPRELVASGHIYKNLLDIQIDRLTVLDLSHAMMHAIKTSAGKTEHKWVIYWNCQCRCGKMVTRSNRYLLWAKKTKSCGCADPKRKNYRKKIIDPD